MDVESRLEWLEREVMRLRDLIEQLRPKQKQKSKEGELVRSLIAIYVRSWQERYRTKARPKLGGKEQGILKRLVGEYPFEQLSDLLQVYCQMKVPWFDQRGHDLVTFEHNLNRIALAKEKGDGSLIDWAKVFGDEERSLPKANPETATDVWGEQLCLTAG